MKLLRTQKGMAKHSWVYFNINEASIHHWRNNYEFIFSCGVTTKYFSWAKKGKYPEVDGLLHFVTKIYAKEWLIMHRELELREREIAKSLRIDKRNFKADSLLWLIYVLCKLLNLTNFLLALNRSCLTSSKTWLSWKKWKFKCHQIGKHPQNSQNWC